MSQTEVRKLPKKSIIIILVLIIIGIAGFLLITLSKQAKMEEVLGTLGYKNVESVRVYNVSQVEDEVTRRRGELYKISFFNKETNQECHGLIYKNNNKYREDVECK
jgi:GrpB-like predicted nucleotidyltransferase (UPF0157 family)